MTAASKAILSLIAIFFLSTGVNCCGDQEPNRFRIIDIVANHGINGQTDLVRVSAPNQDIPAGNYAIEITPSNEFLAAKQVATLVWIKA